MKILHTADWHIGKWVNGYSMLEDQRIILQQMLKQIERERPDVILIAGDLYDRSIPPLGAVELLNETLSTIVSDFQIPVIAIAGNHDSNTRLQFGSRLLKASGLHLIGMNQIPFEKIKLQDSFGDVIFYPIAYMDPLAVAQMYKDETIRTHEQAMAKIFETLMQDFDPSKRNVAIAHGYFASIDSMFEFESNDNISGETDKKSSSYMTNDSLRSVGLQICDSEKRLSIGGNDLVSTHYFEPFHYTALGHLHSHQKVGSTRIQYAGSPLKYSFSEMNHRKGMIWIDMDAHGQIQERFIPLTPKRDFKIVRGYLQDIIDAGNQGEEPCKDYIRAEIEDKQILLSPMAKLKAVYPYAMELVRVYQMSNETKKREKNPLKIQENSPLDLFCTFYCQVTEEEANKDEIAWIVKALECYEKGEQEK